MLLFRPIRCRGSENFAQSSPRLLEEFVRWREPGAGQTLSRAARRAFDAERGLAHLPAAHGHVETPGFSDHGLLRLVQRWQAERARADRRRVGVRREVEGAYRARRPGAVQDRPRIAGVATRAETRPEVELKSP